MLSRAVPLGNGAVQGYGNSVHDATVPSHQRWEQALTTVQGKDSDLRVEYTRWYWAGLRAVLDVHGDTMTRAIS